MLIFAPVIVIQVMMIYLTAERHGATQELL